MPPAAPARSSRPGPLQDPHPPILIGGGGGEQLTLRVIEKTWSPEVFVFAEQVIPAFR